MVTEIYEILEDEGYDCDVLTDEQWEDFNQEWEDECDDFLESSVENRKKEIVFEWAHKTGVKKK